MVPKGWPLIPSGLGAGDSFRLLFVTDGTVDASTNDVGRYNIFVQERGQEEHNVQGQHAMAVHRPGLGLQRHRRAGQHQDAQA